MTASDGEGERRSSWLWRTLISPVGRMLRRGASPRRLAWSVAAGVMIGVNPVIGSSTLAALAVAHLLKLNHTAAQIGVQGAYPLQLLLLLPFLRAGAWVFRAAPLSMKTIDILAMIRQHPLQVVRFLWTWEWHALVVWAALCVVVTPLLAAVLRHVLERTLPRHTRPV